MNGLLDLFPTQKNLVDVLCNPEKIYEGDLVQYGHIIFTKAQNLRRPYHNFRHMMHVTWLCLSACIFYRGTLTPRQMRNLLIAAMFHDFDHSGMKGEDDLNLIRAMRALRIHILPEDKFFLPDICHIMTQTEFPHKLDSSDLTLLCQIIRDADMGQAFAEAWIQQVVFGLAEEWGITPSAVLAMQPKFLREMLKPCTDWGKQMYSQEKVDSKVLESQYLESIFVHGINPLKVG